jgi:hypothetical protein
MGATAILTAGFVICVVVVILGVARRDAPTAGAGILGAAILSVLALLSGASDRGPHCGRVRSV